MNYFVEFDAVVILGRVYVLLKAEASRRWAGSSARESYVVLCGTTKLAGLDAAAAADDDDWAGLIDQL